MNHHVNDQLLKWATGKPYLLSFTGPMMAFGADAIARLLSDRKATALREKWLWQRDPKFATYYESLPDLLKDAPPSLYGSSKAELSEQSVREHVAAVGKLLSGGLDEEGAGELLRLLRDTEFRKEATQAWKKQQRDQFQELATGPTPSQTAEGWAEAETDPAVGFMISIMAEYLIRNREPPQHAVRRLESEPDLVEPLLQLDLAFVNEAPFRACLRRRDGIERLKVVLPTLSKAPRRLKRREVFDALAGLISLVAELSASPVTASEIKRLFDLAAVSRSGDPYAKETAVPPSPEAWTKMLQRQRAGWRAWLDPDNNLSKQVRALSQAVA